MSGDVIAGRRVLFDQCPHDFAAAVLFGVPAPFRADRIDDQQPAPAFVVVARTASRFGRVTAGVLHQDQQPGPVR